MSTSRKELILGEIGKKDAYNVRSTVALLWFVVLLGVPFISSIYSIKNESNLRPDNNSNRFLWPVVGFCTAIAWILTVRTSKGPTQFWLLVGAYFTCICIAGVLIVYEGQTVAAFKDSVPPAVNTDVLFGLAVAAACTAAVCAIVSYNISPTGGALLVPFVLWSTYLVFVHGIGYSFTKTALIMNDNP